MISDHKENQLVWDVEHKVLAQCPRAHLKRLRITREKNQIRLRGIIYSLKMQWNKLCEAEKRLRMRRETGEDAQPPTRFEKRIFWHKKEYICFFIHQIVFLFCEKGEKKTEVIFRPANYKVLIYMFCTCFLLLKCPNTISSFIWCRFESIQQTSLELYLIYVSE